MGTIEIKQDAINLVGFEFAFVLFGWKFTVIVGIKGAKVVKEISAEVK